MSQEATAGTPPVTNPTTPVTQPNPAFQTPPTGAPGGPPVPISLSLTIDEYNRFKGIERAHAELLAHQQTELDKAEQARLKAMADKGEADKALEQQRTTWQQKFEAESQKYQKLEGSLFSAHQDSVLSSALAGVVFAGKTPEAKAEKAKQLRGILEPLFETSRDATGALVTREKGTGRPAADVLKEAFATDRFDHFFSAQSRGGSGTDGTHAAANPEQIAPGSVEANKAFIDQWKSKAQKTGGGFGQRQIK